MSNADISGGGSGSFSGASFTETVTAASGGTVTLVLASTIIQTITGTTSSHSIKLPDATTLANGHLFILCSAITSTGTVAIKNNASTTLYTIRGGGRVLVILQDNSTANGTWMIAPTLSPNMQASSVNGFWLSGNLNFPTGADIGTTNAPTQVAMHYLLDGTGVNIAFDADNRRIYDTDGILVLVDASLTQCYDEDSVVKIDWKKTKDKGVDLKGTIDRDDAPAGYVGEYIESVIAEGGAVSFSDSSAQIITTIELTPGDWDVTGIVCMRDVAGLISKFWGRVTSDSDMNGGTGLGNDTTAESGVTLSTNESACVTIPNFRVNINTTTSYNLIVRVDGGGGNAYGRISARRVR